MLAFAFTCPGIAAHFHEKFHRKFSLFDASAWKTQKIFRSDHTFMFFSHFLLRSLPLCSIDDVFCLYVEWHDGSHDRKRQKPDLDEIPSQSEISTFFGFQLISINFLRSLIIQHNAAWKKKFSKCSTLRLASFCRRNFFRFSLSALGWFCFRNVDFCRIGTHWKMKRSANF